MNENENTSSVGSDENVLRPTDQESKGMDTQCLKDFFREKLDALIPIAEKLNGFVRHTEDAESSHYRTEEIIDQIWDLEHERDLNRVTLVKKIRLLIEIRLNIKRHIGELGFGILPSSEDNIKAAGFKDAKEVAFDLISELEKIPKFSDLVRSGEIDLQEGASQGEFEDLTDRIGDEINNIPLKSETDSSSAAS